MTDYNIPPASLRASLQGWFMRFAASGWVPAKWYQKSLPELEERQSKTGDLNIEVVSHCWKYAHLLNYQLSSLVRFPPTRAHIVMTVFYCEEDLATAKLLDFFAKQQVPNVRWNWRALPKQALFRRAIGRNIAALQTDADWIWFTDCDLMFREACIDTLVEQLQGRRDTLVYPRIERCTSLLTNEDPMLSFDPQNIEVEDVDTSQFDEYVKTRATGPLQITHGDVARHCGYCKALPYYQQPSDIWCKAHEDRAYRWLLRTQGTPLEIPGVYRIRHIFKGRYTGSALSSGLRAWLRKNVSG